MSTVQDIVTQYPEVHPLGYWDRVYFMGDALLSFRKVNKDASKKGKAKEAKHAEEDLDVDELADTMESQMDDGSSFFVPERRTYEEWLKQAPDGLSPTAIATLDKKHCAKPGCNVLLTTATARWHLQTHDTEEKKGIITLGCSPEWCWFHYQQKAWQVRLHSPYHWSEATGWGMCRTMNKLSDTTAFSTKSGTKWTVDSTRGTIWRIAEAGEKGCSGREALEAVEHSDLEILYSKLKDGGYTCADTGVELSLSSWEGLNRPSIDRQARQVDKESGRSMPYGYYEAMCLNKVVSRSWNYFCNQLDQGERMDLAVYLASNLHDDRRLAAVSVLKAYRKQADDSADQPIYESSVKSLRALLPDGHTVTAEHRKSAMASVGSAVAMQKKKSLAGRDYTHELSSRSELVNASISTLGVCVLTGVILKSISVDAQTCAGGHNEVTVLPTHSHVNRWKEAYYRYINEKALCSFLRSDDGKPVLLAVMQRYEGKHDEVEMLDFISEACFQDFKVFIKNALGVLMKREPKRDYTGVLKEFLP